MWEHVKHAVLVEEAIDDVIETRRAVQDVPEALLEIHEGHLEVLRQDVALMLIDRVTNLTALVSYMSRVFIIEHRCLCDVMADIACEALNNRIKGTNRLIDLAGWAGLESVNHCEVKLLDQCILTFSPDVHLLAELDQFRQ